MKILLLLCSALFSAATLAGPYWVNDYTNTPGNNWCKVRVRPANTSFDLTTSATWYVSPVFAAEVNPTLGKRCVVDWAAIYNAVWVDKPVVVEITFSNNPNIPSQDKWAFSTGFAGGNGTLRWVSTPTTRFAWISNNGYSFPLVNGW